MARHCAANSHFSNTSLQMEYLKCSFAAWSSAALHREARAAPTTPEVVSKSLRLFTSHLIAKIYHKKTNTKTASFMPQRCHRIHPRCTESRPVAGGHTSHEQQDCHPRKGNRTPQKNRNISRAPGGGGGPPRQSQRHSYQDLAAPAEHHHP